MVTVALALFKKCAPYIAAALIVTAIWMHGYHTADAKRIQEIADITAQSNAVLNEANIKNAEIEKQLSVSALIIGETYEKHQTEIANITDDNRQLLAKRLRESSGRCNTMSNSSKTTSSGNEEFTDYWLVQQAIADRLIERHEYADQIVETARACQDYVKTITEQLRSSK
jgi:hypothetical protein